MSAVLTTEAVVTLTPSAVLEVKEMLSREENAANKGLRLFIENGGCSGLQYGMVFDEPRDGDLSADFEGVSVLVDSVSAEYLRGTVVDFSDSLTGGGFKISNPRARSSCGCGKSFEA
jgi:iron-sulfur cluster assembly accessory protein